MDQSLADLSIDYHGPALVDKLAEENVAVQLPSFLSLSKYGKCREIPEDKHFTDRLVNFIARKADVVYSHHSTTTKHADASDGVYANLPPLEHYMNTPSDLRRKHFYQCVQFGDILIGTLHLVEEQGLVVTILGFDGTKARTAVDLNIKAFCPVREVPELGPNQGPLEAFNASDLVRGVVIGVSTESERIFLSFRWGSLPNNMGKPNVNLGLIKDEDLPEYLRDTSVTRGYLQDMEHILEFSNPSNIAALCMLNSIPETTSLSAMRGLNSTVVPDSDFANSLRKSQSERWALHSVKEGVSFFKKGKYTEALQLFNKAIDIDTENVEALVARGALYANNEAYQKAIEDFEFALKFNSKHSNARKYLCHTLIAKARRDQEAGDGDVETLFRRALEIDPSLEEAKIGLQKIVSASRDRLDSENNVDHNESTTIDLEATQSPENTNFKTRETLRTLIKDKRRDLPTNTRSRHSSEVELEDDKDEQYYGGSHASETFKGHSPGPQGGYRSSRSTSKSPIHNSNFPRSRRSESPDSRQSGPYINRTIPTDLVHERQSHKRWDSSSDRHMDEREYHAARHEHFENSSPFTDEDLIRLNTGVEGDFSRDEEYDDRRAHFYDHNRTHNNHSSNNQQESVTAYRRSPDHEPREEMCRARRQIDHRSVGEETYTLHELPYAQDEGLLYNEPLNAKKRSHTLDTTPTAGHGIVEKHTTDTDVHPIPENTYSERRTIGIRPNVHRPNSSREPDELSNVDNFVPGGVASSKWKPVISSANRDAFTTEDSRNKQKSLGVKTSSQTIKYCDTVPNADISIEIDVNQSSIVENRKIIAGGQHAAAASVVKPSSNTKHGPPSVMLPRNIILGDKASSLAVKDQTRRSRWDADAIASKVEVKSVLPKDPSRDQSANSGSKRVPTTEYSRRRSRERRVSCSSSSSSSSSSRSSSRSPSHKKVDTRRRRFSRRSRSYSRERSAENRARYRSPSTPRERHKVQHGTYSGDKRRRSRSRSRSGGKRARYHSRDSHNRYSGAPNKRSMKHHSKRQFSGDNSSAVSAVKGEDSAPGVKPWKSKWDTPSPTCAAQGGVESVKAQTAAETKSSSPKESLEELENFLNCLKKKKSAN